MTIAVALGPPPLLGYPVDRRYFVTSLGSAIAWPFAGRASDRLPTIGYLGSGAPYQSTDSGRIGSLKGLADLGYVEDKTQMAVFRFSEGHDDRSPGFAKELVDLKVDVIATTGNPSAALAAKQATSTIPIVFITGGDPVAYGLVDSLAHPGANVTGVTLISADLNRKRLDLLIELVPGAKSFGVLANPNAPTTENRLRQLDEMARQMGIQLQIARPTDKSEFDATFATLSQAQVGAATIVADTMFMSYRQPLIDAAARFGLPVIYESRDFAVQGGLISYGADLYALGYRFGSYLGMVLNGTKPVDLPVEKSSKFQLVINQKTAKALNLRIPDLILIRADEVIE